MVNHLRPSRPAKTSRRVATEEDPAPAALGQEDTIAVPQTIRTTKLGKHELRLVRKDGVFHGLVVGATIRIEGADPDEVWTRLQQEAGKADPRYFGYDGARARFLKFFPNGFASQGFAAQERDYKVEAKARLDAQAPLERALGEDGLGEAVLDAFNTNMLSPFEKMRVRDLLRGPAADAFVRAAAAFAADPGEAALRRLDGILRAHDCAKWTIVTYLPFLWRPEAHMFLKPEVTKDYAARVGHPFAEIYEARLAPVVYRSLLDLASRTHAAVADLGPRDLIDIQSFIWTVGAYREDVDGVFE